ncbi:DUF4168 domain-containing protein [Oceanicola sp. 22II-s10i]|uniref:DUF4168 domain-containing protein n=1 Tax=Oceanicola sp. 22II-s10i TaxID=1317116 RepID=UPI000B5275D0|nr:DUF4168 domain-containing protein [Oceanicola sp. 22II-s10i]
MTTIASKLLRGSIIAGVALAPVSALAQSAATPQDDTAQQTAPETMPGTEAADFSEAQLESFIEATVKIQELRDSFLPQIEAAASEEDKQALARQAQTEMQSAVEETEGLDVETYNQIGRAAQSDEGLNARLVAMLQDRTPAPGTAGETRDEG